MKNKEKEIRKSLNIADGLDEEGEEKSITEKKVDEIMKILNGESLEHSKIILNWINGLIERKSIVTV